MAMRDMRGLNEFIKQIRSTKVRGAARSSTPRARGAKEGGEVHVQEQALPPRSARVRGQFRASRWVNP